MGKVSVWRAVAKRDYPSQRWVKSSIILFAYTEQGELRRERRGKAKEERYIHNSCSHLRLSSLQLPSQPARLPRP